MGIRIVLAFRPLEQKGFCTLLEAERDLAVVGQAENSQTAMQQVRAPGAAIGYAHRTTVDRRVYMKIILADDHQVLREGLCALLEQESDLEVVAQADNGRTAVERALEHRPDVVVMDIGMPDLNGIEATQQLKAVLAEVKVVALSQHADKRYVMAMFKAGASGFVLKRGAFGELVQAIRAAAQGQVYLSPSVATAVMGDYVQRLSASPATGNLTAREREVLQLLVEGQTTPEIAARLHISEKTVGTHRQHIMDKLDLHSLPALTKYALREGITSLDN